MNSCASNPGAGASRARDAYNAAADHYDDAPLRFWDRAGSAAVNGLNLKRGHRVLDVPCGSGASAIPAAEAVGPTGAVLGVDLAQRLLDRASAKAHARALHNTEWRCADMTTLDLPDQSFDAVICVFGVFFAPDMPAFAANLWRMLRPGGALAVTTWGPRWAEPAFGAFQDAVRRVRPDLHSAFNPWDRIVEPAAVRQLLIDAGAPHARIEIEPVPGVQPLRSPEDAWTILLGAGTRWTIDQLGPAGEQVRTETIEAVRRLNADSVQAHVIHARARK